MQSLPCHSNVPVSDPGFARVSILASRPPAVVALMTMNDSVCVLPVAHRCKHVELAIECDVAAAVQGRRRMRNKEAEKWQMKTKGKQT